MRRLPNLRNLATAKPTSGGAFRIWNGDTIHEKDGALMEMKCEKGIPSVENQFVAVVHSIRDGLESSTSRIWILFSQHFLGLTGTLPEQSLGC